MRTLLVTGANSAIAAAYAEKYGNQYDYILAHYAHRRDRIDSLGSLFGERVVSLQADLSKPDEVKRLIESISEYDITGYLHVAAPGLRHIRFAKGDEKDFEDELEVVYWSFLRISQSIIPKMAKKGYGRIAAILTEYTVKDQPPYLSHYISAKFALLGLLKSIASEYAAKGIRINGISPGMIETDFIDKLPQYIVDDSAKSSSRGRNLKPDDIIPTLNYLLSEESDGITGQNILIK